MTTSIDARCIHCDAALAARDLSEGWCDSCGKRLPSAGKPSKAAAPAAAVAPAAAGRSRLMLWGGVAVGLLFAAAAIAAASAG